MFKNYHVVIFKDREGGFRNLRLRGWLGILLFAVMAGLAALCFYLWSFHTRARVLEHELAEARRLVQEQDGQLLNLAGKLRDLEEDILRVRQFDAKLRVLMNIDKDSAAPANAAGSAGVEEIPESPVSASLGDPQVLARHRELFARRAHGLIEDLSEVTHLEEVRQQSLLVFMRANKDTLLSTPSIWPVKGFLTSGFGYRNSPFLGPGAMHKGLDISNRVGTPIWAPARGTVTFAAWDGSYGNSIIIDHGNNVTTRYAHMSRLLVKAGDYVQRGDVIGALGNTGRSTGPHLHYEVHVGGVPVNPMRYILN